MAHLWHHFALVGKDADAQDEGEDEGVEKRDLFWRLLDFP